MTPPRRVLGSAPELAIEPLRQGARQWAEQRSEPCYLSSRLGDGGTMLRTNDDGETFGAWLLAQKEREGLVGDLGGDEADRKFPSDATPMDTDQGEEAS